MKKLLRDNRKRFFITGFLALIALGGATALFIASGDAPSVKEQDASPEKKQKHTNRLINEKSPYLLQHAHNPVDWYAWGEEAFEKARKENKLIFLSIGYSTCYWCHVMEREVFENEEIAALMNQHVVSIKVDREERPDVDRIYMAALQTMTRGSGGWPMSMFLTPDLKPFYGATYVPADGFKNMLTQIQKIWTTEPDRINQSGQSLTEFLKQNMVIEPAAVVMEKSLLTRGYEQFRQSYDKEHAGFGGGPKFPRPAVFDFLFRYHHRTGEREALDMSLATLRRMAEGGMYDHLGGGFHRYSVDGEWRVPLFEMMLYDQAQ
ncbi:MAG: DUF255 domain-containing protein, partial [Blastocatellia bacterium]|nr:DUF255 domain-containing protein [Blastocatellia bacterium]